MRKVEDLIDEKRLIQAGVESPFWKKLTALIQAQVMARRQTLFGTQITGLDAAFGLARSQGEVAGLQFILALPDILLQDLQADIETLLAEEREKENENDGSESRQ